MSISIGIAATISSSSWRAVKGEKKKKKKINGVLCVSARGNLKEQYRMLRVPPGASEKEIKKAFRSLALQYHPDVCKGSNCGVQFHRINEAYDIVISSLRASEEEEQQLESWQNSNEWVGDEDDEQFRGMYDSSWDMWEEWMGWEGAAI